MLIKFWLKKAIYDKFLIQKFFCSATTIRKKTSGNFSAWIWLPVVWPVAALPFLFTHWIMHAPVCLPTWEKAQLENSRALVTSWRRLSSQMDLLAAIVVLMPMLEELFFTELAILDYLTLRNWCMERNWVSCGHGLLLKYVLVVSKIGQKVDFFFKIEQTIDFCSRLHQKSIFRLKNGSKIWLKIYFVPSYYSKFLFFVFQFFRL